MKILYISLLIGFCFPIFADSETFYVLTNSGALNLRDKPEKGKVIAKIKKGEKLVSIPNSSEDIPYMWVKVKSEKGQIGYASREFLSKLQPSDLENSEIFGIFRLKDEPANTFYIHPFAFTNQKEFIGTGTEDPEVKYLLNQTIKNKKEFSVFDRMGNFQKSVTIQKIEQSGCQNYSVGTGKVDEKKKSTDIDEVRFALSDKSGIKNIKIKDKTNDALVTALKSEMEKEFKKNKVSPEIINQVTMDNSFLVTDAFKNSYVLGRFSYKKEGSEFHNVFIIAAVENSQMKNIIHSQYQSLTEEQGVYGGQFHFLGGFNKDKGLILIFHHNGFDGFIRGVYKIESGKWKELAIGGGDAC